MDIANDKQNLSLARLQAFQMNRPSFWDESAVSQYHEVVSALAKAFERDLTSFLILESEMKPYEDESGSTSWVEAGRQGGRFRTQYSEYFPARNQMLVKRYCDKEFAQRKLDSLVLYIQNLIQDLQPTPKRPKIGF
ncbi:MAG: hypothetical protein WAN35_20165 [Terracidiphilus sp.]